MWYLYILECKNKVLYTGVTDNLERRFIEHRSGEGGHFTKSFGAEKILYTERYLEKISVLKREKQIKGWTRKKKMALINGNFRLLKKI